MRLGISILASISIFLQLSAAAKNFKNVESAILDSEKQKGKTKKGDIYVFKEWWAPKKSNLEDIRRGYSHVRTVVVEVTDTRSNIPKLKGRAFDVGYFKLDEQGKEAVPTAADQVIDQDGNPAAELLMAKSDETWYANRYKKGGRLAEVSTKNQYRLIIRNPPQFQTIDDIYKALRVRGEEFLDRPNGRIWVRDKNSCTTYCEDLIQNVILWGLDDMSYEVEGSGSLDSPHGYTLSPQAGASSYSAEQVDPSHSTKTFNAYDDRFEDELAGPSGT